MGLPNPRYKDKCDQGSFSSVDAYLVPFVLAFQLSYTVNCYVRSCLPKSFRFLILIFISVPDFSIRYSAVGRDTDAIRSLDTYPLFLAEMLKLHLQVGVVKDNTRGQVDHLQDCINLNTTASLANAANWANYAACKLPKSRTLAFHNPLLKATMKC